MLKKILGIAGLVVIAGILTGCVTQQTGGDTQAKVVGQYVAQPATYSPFSVEGCSEITYKAAPGQTVKMTVTTPLQQPHYERVDNKPTTTSDTTSDTIVVH